jgi:hypothetical protein
VYYLLVYKKDGSYGWGALVPVEVGLTVGQGCFQKGCPATRRPAVKYG